MKKSELFFSLLLLPLDYLMIFLAGISAYYIRFADVTTDIRPAIFSDSLPMGPYLKIVLFVAFLWLIIFALSGLYNVKSARKIAKEIYKIILACSTGLMLVVILIFMRRELFDSRFIVLAAWVLAIFYVSFARILIRWLQRYLFKFGIGVHKVVIIGDSKTADNLMREFSINKRLGFEVVKRLRDFSMQSAQELSDGIVNFKHRNEKYIDEIIQSDPNLKKGETLRLYDFADEHHVTFKYAADLLSTKVLRTEVAEISGIPIVEVKKTSLEGWGRIIKRIIDILISGFLIVVLFPFLAFVALVLKLDSRGPVIYKNERVSKYGVFKVYKFRSMLLQYCTGDDYDDSGNALDYERKLIQEKNTKTEGPLYKIGDDPRITRVGKIIRRWSIDELPQLFNVFFGNMSMVGPRPHQPREVAKYEHHHKKLLGIKPGITGLAQISGRSDLSFEEEVKLETYYIENWSMLLDFSIIIRTPLAVIRPRKVE